jgi:lipopolysaccharide transport system ATP-binding protein
MSVVIEVDHVSKQYRLGQIGGRRLVDDLNRWVAKARGKEDPTAKIGAPTVTSETIWALKDVSFSVAQGETVGLIGFNGSGKSTALKILSRVTAPTLGEVRVKGRIASLLEVGTGFHPELTGRENIFLNGAILGMTKTEIRKKFDEIVAFSEVEQFIDTPVKRYSSGMYVRLAFAIAAHLEPEILIVDEVLAVGDAAFQQKCLGKMKDVAGEGRTIFFVSHSMEAVRRLCTRGIWLHHGELQMDDVIDAVATAYSSRKPREAASLGNAAYQFSVQEIRLRNQDGEECAVFRPGDDLAVEIHYEAQKPIYLPYFAIVVQNLRASCFAANMLLDGRRPTVLEGKGRISCVFKAVPLLPQNYIVQMAIRAGNGTDMILPYHDVARFSVSCSLADYGYKGDFMARASDSTPVVVPHEWHLPDGEVASVSLTSQSQSSDFAINGK